jgi:uncharacterized membrane protein
MQDDGRARLDELASAAAGAALLGASRRQGASRDVALRVAGAALLVRAAWSWLNRTLLDEGERRRRVRIRRRLTVERPIRDVFAFFHDFENFPQVFGALERVVDTHDGRSTWYGKDSSGQQLTCRVVVTQYVPPSVVAWESAPREEIQLSGRVRLTAEGESRTVIDTEICYDPPVATREDSLRSLAEPAFETQVLADLERLPFYLESLPTTPPVEVEPVRETA